MYSIIPIHRISNLLQPAQAEVVLGQRSTYLASWVSNPSQPAQADGRQGRRSIYKGSLGGTVQDCNRAEWGQQSRWAGPESGRASTIALSQY
jgi:hypothetical protein